VSFATTAKSTPASRTGGFALTFSATPLAKGTIGLKSLTLVTVGARRRFVTLAAKGFTASAGGRATVRFRLTSAERRVLARLRRLRFAVTATLGGRTFTTTVVLRAPARR
jgi:hypothetical protein